MIPTIPQRDSTKDLEFIVGEIRLNQPVKKNYQEYFDRIFPLVKKNASSWCGGLVAGIIQEIYDIYLGTGSNFNLSDSNPFYLDAAPLAIGATIFGYFTSKTSEEKRLEFTGLPGIYLGAIMGQGLIMQLLP